MGQKYATTMGYWRSQQETTWELRIVDLGDGKKWYSHLKDMDDWKKEGVDILMNNPRIPLELALDVYKKREFLDRDSPIIIFEKHK